MKDKKDDRGKPAKPYRRPTLAVYGDLRTLTRAKKGKKSDGGGGKPNTFVSGQQGNG